MFLGVVIVIGVCTGNTVCVSLVKPVGIKMCKELCGHLKGCSGFNFKKYNLQCRLWSENDNSNSDEGWAVSRIQKHHDQCPVQNCMTGDRCLQSRQQSHVCLHPDVRGSRSEEPTDGSGRLLLVNRRYPNNSFIQQMNLKTKKLTAYPYFTVSDVLDIVYVASSRKLLISTVKPVEIVAYYLNSVNKSTLLKGNTAVHMAVDEDSKVVFLSLWVPKGSIARMSLEGSNYTVIKHIPLCMFSDIVVDSAQKMVYVSHGNIIKCSSYWGDSSRVVFRGTQVDVMSLNSKEGLLYFNDYRTIKLWRVSEKSISNVMNLEYVPGDILYSHKKLLITRKYQITDIMVIDCLKLNATYVRIEDSAARAFVMPVIRIVP